jgi:hypothetical protein
MQIDSDPDLVPDPAYHFMRIRMRIWVVIFIRCGSGCRSGSLILFDADRDPEADPGYQNEKNDAVPCGSGSTTLLMEVARVYVL